MAADEVVVKDLASKMGIEGAIHVNLKPEPYPDTKHFSYRRFSVQGDHTDISLVLKKAQTDPALRLTTSLKRKLHNEVTFYSQVVPKIRPVLEKMNETENALTAHNLFVPNYYGHDMTEGKEWLAIEEVPVEYKSEADPENLDKEHLKGKPSPLWQSVKRRIPLVLKSAIKDPEARKTNFVTRKFRNEQAFYEHIRSRLLFENRSFSSESVTAGVVRNVKRLTAKNTRFPRLPKVYGSALKEGDEYILLEDLDEYSAHPDPQNLDAKHLKASVQALAAFHSASITWKTSNPIEYLAVANLFCETEMMRPDEADPTADFKTQKMNAALSAAAKACASHLTGPYAVSVEKVCHAANVEAPFWVSTERSEPWSVITHGDCWAKNFLYKYDKNKKIIGVAMVDFKSSRAGSPVLDVTNFLLSSASPECLKDLRPFIEKHKDSMSPKIPNYRSHVHQFGPYGLIASLVHHYFYVLYPNLDVREATRLVENPELAEAYEAEMIKPEAKKSAGSAGRDSPNREMPRGDREKRAALVVKAAHDVRLI